MNRDLDGSLSAIEGLRRSIGRGAFGFVVASLTMGIVFYVLGQDAPSGWILATGVGILLALPVMNVLAVLAMEVRQRDWGFAALAVAVLGLLAFAMWSKVAEALHGKGL
jgi:uncharacterized membrane protein